MIQKPALTKQELRRTMGQLRKTIPFARRQKAMHNALCFLHQLFKSQQYVLSYASFNDEFDTGELNHLLAQNNILALPKVEGNFLRVFHVSDPKNQLKQHPWGMYEPDPLLCKELLPEQLAQVLVPGLAFDRANHRLGYGKGYYDRFLVKIQKTAKLYGLGFLEQHFEPLLPINSSEIPLNDIFLF